MGLACEKLKVFCAVAETKSFSRASEIINLTQPAVSIQIQAFEVEYGTKLFDRTGDITLTAAGEILYRRAKELLSLYAMAEKEISAITGIVKGRIKIGATTTFGNHILPGIIAGFKHTCPRTDITVFVENTRTIIELLHSGAVDFAIVGEVPQSRELMVDLLMSDELVPVVHPAHPSAGKKSVSILEIVDGPIVFREKGSATRRVVEDFLRDNGIDLCDLNISAIMSCTSSIKEAVEKKMGMSFVSEYAVMEEIKSGSLKTVALKEGKIIRNFSLAIPRKAILSHASDMFIRYLKSCSCRRTRNECRNTVQAERPYPAKAAFV